MKKLSLFFLLIFSHLATSQGFHLPINRPAEAERMKAEIAKAVQRYDYAAQHERKDTVEYLNLSNCYLDHLPDFVLEYKNLKTLNISGNQIHSLPKEIKQLKQLEFVDWSGNELSGKKLKTPKLKQVKKLKLEHNDLSSLPRGWRKFRKAEELF